MRKLAAVVLAAALIGCNDVLDPGPTVQSTHDGSLALVVDTGMVAQVFGEQYVLYPTARPGVVRLQGSEERLGQLVGLEARVTGTMAYDGVLHVRECHRLSAGP